LDEVNNGMTKPSSTNRMVRRLLNCLQCINDLLHLEPIDTIVHGLFWWVTLCLVLPFFGSFVISAMTLVRLFRMLYRAVYLQQPLEEPIKNPSLSSRELALVITGCDSGFGRDLVVECSASNKYRVFAGCFKQESLSYFEEMENVTALVVDVTKDEDVSNLAKIVFDWVSYSTADCDEHDGETKHQESHQQNRPVRYIHALVNNAGSGTSGLVDWLGMDDYKKDMEVNCFGQIRIVKAFLPFLKRQASPSCAANKSNKEESYKDARIINMISVAGIVPLIGCTPYSSSKFAAEAFSNSLRLELRDFNIQVVTLNPSFHQTPLVENLVDNTWKMWNTLPSSIKEEYGQEYFNNNIVKSLSVLDINTWRSFNAVNDLFKAIDLRRPRRRYLSGMDSKYVFSVHRLLPDWCQDLLVPRYSYPPAFFSTQQNFHQKEKDN